MAENEKQEFGYQIKKIRCLSFKMNEDTQVDLKEPLTISFSYRNGYNLQEGDFDFILGLTFTPHNAPDNKCFEFEILNRFSVQDLDKYVKDGMLSFPVQAMVNVLSLSISHSRAIISHNLAGTKYNDIMIPITDALPLAKQFFNLDLELPNFTLPK